MSWKQNLGILTLSTFLLFFSFTSLLQVLPLYLKSFDTSDFMIGIINATFTLAAIFARPFSGKLLVIFSRFGTFYFFTAIFFIATLCYFFTLPLWLFLILRFVHGMGWGASNTACNTIATDIIPKKHLGSGIGFFSIAPSLTMMLAPILAIEIYKHFGFNAVVLSSSASILAAIVILFFMRDIKRHSDAKSLFLEKNALIPAFLMLCANSAYGGIISFIVLFAKEINVSNIGIFFAVAALALIILRPLFGFAVDKKGFFGISMIGFLGLCVSFLFLCNAWDEKFIIVSALFYALGSGALIASFQTMAIKRSSNLAAANATFFVGFDSGIFIGMIISGIISQFLGYKNMYFLMSVWLFVVLIFVVIFRKKIF